MKNQPLLLAVLLVSTLFLSGCMTAGYHSSSVNTPEGKALNKGIYFDFFGRGRQVYPEPVVAPVPIYYADPVSNVSYGSSVVYTGAYYGRPVSQIDYSVPANSGGYRYHHPRVHQPTHWPQHHHPPRVWHEPAPRTYVQPPYVLPPTGSTTVVTPRYGAPNLPNYGQPGGSVTVVQPTYRVGPSYPPYAPHGPR